MGKALDIFLDYLFVPKCTACRTRMDKSEDGLCQKCKNQYKDAREEYCDFCGMSASICTCVPPFLLVNGCRDYRKLVFYKTGPDFNPVVSMIYSIKRCHNISLAKFFAREIAEFDLNAKREDTIVTFTPRSRKSYKKYGYDQAKLLAKYVARSNGLVFKSLLKRKLSLKHNEQKKLTFAQRAKNVKGAFKLCNSKIIKGKNIILIDDVVTSRATLGECVSLLYEAGASSVSCRSIGYTYKKNKHKKD